MATRKQIAKGAEAEIFDAGDVVIKRRMPKGYRIVDIDLPLRRFRTKREAKVISRLHDIGIKVPKVVLLDVENTELHLTKIAGDKLRDKLNTNNYPVFCRMLGKDIANMHDADIIHGDLTTSNMIVEKKTDVLYYIDFGLSFFSSKIEDKAVDLHLLRQALESKHNRLWQKAFDAFVKCYGKHSRNATEILLRLEKVESRGRNKGKE
ncbi:Kae1-associated serine/threonine protein kinase [Candidatus Woesearchaeota archaeon]|nr:Kae1-associated serine/threonine protein kinase [Candidatus Woesearchaeota archaeon]